MLAACRFRRVRIGSGPRTPRSRCARSAPGRRRRPGTTSSSTSPPGRRRSARRRPGRPSIELDADAGSLRVIEGTGGIQALGEDDIANIQQTIDDEVLKRREIASARPAAEPQARRTARGRGRADARRHDAADRASSSRSATTGRSAPSAVVKQSAWGMKPYSALFGALKVADEVEVALEGHL